MGGCGLGLLQQTNETRAPLSADERGLTADHGACAQSQTRYVVRVKGSVTHSCSPRAGVAMVECMNLIIGEVGTREREREKTPRPPVPGRTSASRVRGPRTCLLVFGSAVANAPDVDLALIILASSTRNDSNSKLTAHTPGPRPSYAQQRGRRTGLLPTSL